MRKKIDFKISDKQEGNSLNNIKQSDILLKLSQNGSMTFNQLWNKEGMSNNFAYHLKKVQQEGLVEKNVDGYSLTIKGERKIHQLNNNGAPSIIVHILVMQDDRILVNKEGEIYQTKLTSSNHILECAENLLLEETGFTCDLELKGLISSKKFKENHFLTTQQSFVVKATEPKLNLHTKIKHKWVSASKVNPHLVDIVSSPNFKLIERDVFWDDSGEKVKVRKNLLC